MYTSDVPARPAGSWEWWLTHSPLHLLWLGAESVYVFFILSGIVLVLPALRSNKFDWWRYYPSRLVRLYIPVWASLILSVLVTVTMISLGNDGLFAAREDLLTPTRLARDAVLITGVSNIDGVLWSLRWEVLFSLLLPLYVLFAVWLRRLFWMKVATLLAIALTGTVALGMRGVAGEGLFYLSMFAIGALMAVEMNRIRIWAARIEASVHRRAYWAALITVAGVLLGSHWALLLLSPPQSVLLFARVLSLIGAALFVFVGAFHPASRRLLETPFVQWLGMVSFSLYLTHAMVVEVTVELLPTGFALLALPISILVSLGVAMVFRRLVEAPSHRLSQVMKGRPRAASDGPDDKPTSPASSDLARDAS